MAKAKTMRTPADYGTPELARRFSVVPKLIGNSYGARVMDDTEINRLLMKDLINPLQHSLLRALAEKLERASFNELRAINYDATHFSEPHTMGDRKAERLARARNLIKGMITHHLIGEQRFDALVRLVSEDQPWPYGIEALHDAVSGLQVILTNRRV